MLKKFLCLSICTLFLGGLVQAQGVTTGSLSGVVVDPNGDPLPGVAVVATLTTTSNRYATVTDAMGRFRMVNVKVGGFYRVPNPRELRPLRDQLERGRDLAIEIVELDDDGYIKLFGEGEEVCEFDYCLVRGFVKI